jgi:hypothetical protein
MRADPAADTPCTAKSGPSRSAVAEGNSSTALHRWVGPRIRGLTNGPILMNICENADYGLAGFLSAPPACRHPLDSVGAPQPNHERKVRKPGAVIWL